MTNPLTGKLNGFDNRKLRSNNNRTANKKLSKILRDAALRKIEPGFPIETPFTCTKDINDYFSGETILCLLCGRRMKALGMHLRVIHGTTVDEYKEKYGLPYSRGLDSSPTRKIRNEVGTSSYENGNGISTIPENERAAIVTRALKQKKRTSGYMKLHRYENLKKLNGHENPYTHEDFERILSIMVEKNMLFTEVCALDGVPSHSTTHEYIRENPEFRKKLDETWEKLPFATQAKAGRLGPRFMELATKLRNSGMTYADIANQLGVSTMAVYHRLNGGYPKT